VGRCPNRVSTVHVCGSNRQISRNLQARGRCALCTVRGLRIIRRQGGSEVNISHSIFRAGETGQLIPKIIINTNSRGGGLPPTSRPSPPSTLGPLLPPQLTSPPSLPRSGGVIPLPLSLPIPPLLQPLRLLALLLIPSSHPSAVRIRRRTAQWRWPRASFATSTAVRSPSRSIPEPLRRPASLTGQGGQRQRGRGLKETRRTTTWNQRGTVP
jgi:hypothetical protein